MTTTHIDRQLDGIASRGYVAIRRLENGTLWPDPETYDLSASLSRYAAEDLDRRAPVFARANPIIAVRKAKIVVESW